MGKLSISNESHNIRNIIWNAKSLQTGMYVRIWEVIYQGRIWTGAAWEKDTPFVSALLDNF